MKRFFFEEEDDDGNDDEMMDQEGREMPEFIPEIFAMSHQENPAIHILNYSVRICEQSFFWKFLSHSKKTEMIEKVFNNLMRLMETGPTEEEE